MNKKLALVSCAVALGGTAPSCAATLLGAYSFDGTLNSSVAGGPTLGAIDPTGTSGFVTDTVFGESRTVWAFKGSTSSALQGGLTFNQAGLGLTSDSYSIAMTFMFDDRQNNWRRIYDVTGRQSDNGFYVNTSNQLAVFPTSGSNAAFNSGAYRNVVLTVNGNQVSAYIDGGASFTATTTQMAIGASPLVLFADNVAGGGQGEWSSGKIAALRVFDGVLSADEISSLNERPLVTPVPEPASWLLMIGGMGLVGGFMRRRALRAALA